MKKTLEINELRSLVVSKLHTKYKLEYAQKMADAIMFAELANRKSHGLIRFLPRSYGPMDETPQGEPIVNQISPYSVKIDMKGNPGYLATALATEQAINIASKHNFAIVTTKGTESTSGCLAYYAEKITQHNLIGIIMGNCVPLITPIEGMEKKLGTNPLAIGIPSKNVPFIYDTGTSAISYGEVIYCKSQQKKIPEGVALDKQGNITTDPDSALKGGLLAFGGHKGFGLALAIEILTAALSGASYCGERKNEKWGNLIFAISPALLGDVDAIKEDVSKVITATQQTKTKNNIPVRIPGEKTLKTHDKALKQGIVEIDLAIYNILTS